MQRPFSSLGRVFALSGIASSALLDRCSSIGLRGIDLFGSRIQQVAAAPVYNFSTYIDGQGVVPSGLYTGLNFCNVTVTYTHPGRDDEIQISAALPLQGWNGRFLAQGGGGWLTGFAANYLIPGVARGYAVASTNGGHSVYSQSAASWALDSPGNVNLNLFQDFSSVALNDLAALGKQITSKFYEKEPKASYWLGCSTGGRQGLMLAQRYPDAFDGIAAAAPAINWVQFLMAVYWPQQVMNELEYYPPPCEFEAIVNASIKSCDILDGVEDGIISDPDICNFDAEILVGKSFDCNGTPLRFTSKAAKIANAIWTGPHGGLLQRYNWYGLTKGASFVDGIANTSCPKNDTENCTGSPFPIAEEWIKYFVMKDADFDPSNMTRAQYFNAVHKSIQEYDSIIGTSDPDLSNFKKRGGKMITWHGLADQVIFPNGTRSYYDQVLQLDSDAKDFYRFFEAPGVAHCGGGPGPAPDIFGPLEKVVKWVEEGEAPEVLEGVGQNGKAITRPLCLYPKRQKYVGGDPARNSSFTCVDA